METLQSLPKKEYVFYLEKRGYTLEKALNNPNRWGVKIVSSVFDKDSRELVATTYARKRDYLKFIETTTFLKCKAKLLPGILRLCPEDNTVICNYVGEFLQDYLLAHSESTISSLIAAFDYLKDINSINQKKRRFIIPSIIKLSVQLSEDIDSGFEFLPKFRAILPSLEKANIKFMYGYGIEDPHIWNFRILNGSESMPLAFTTDFDYFSDTLNYYWELGYLYATFRWLRKISAYVAAEAENTLRLLTGEIDPKSEFMFWLGVLSSYCGYKDSVCNLLKGGRTKDLKKEYSIIKELDKKVTCLASNLMTMKGAR